MKVKDSNGQLRTPILIYHIDNICYVLVKSSDGGCLEVCESGDLNFYSDKVGDEYSIHIREEGDALIYYNSVHLNDIFDAIDAPSTQSEVMNKLPY